VVGGLAANSSTFELSAWVVVAAAAACRAVLELSDDILEVKGVRL